MVDEVPSIRRVIGLENGEEIVIIPNIYSRVSKSYDGWNKSGVLSFADDGKGQSQGQKQCPETMDAHSQITVLGADPGLLVL